jgi:hypothetical protein
VARFKISNKFSGIELGEWEAGSAQEALDAFARAAGYASYAEEAAIVGDQAKPGGRAEIEVREINPS